MGQPVPATVLSVRTLGSAKSSDTQASFRFQDANGTTRQGLAHHVGKGGPQSDDQARGGYVVGEVATALYDPARPTRADLYPLGMLTLVEDVPSRA